MPRPIHLYVSSSPDLTVEREVVAQVVATMPLTIGWRIGHTPLPGQLGSESVARVEDCHLYAVILGHDFAAPMGHELRLAVARGRSPFAAYRYECMRSPSALDAVRTLDLTWQRFSSPEELRTKFRRDLLQAVLKQATMLRLELDEVQRLLEQAREIEADADQGAAGRQVERRRAEAGRSGRILGREVWEAEG